MNDDSFYQMNNDSFYQRSGNSPTISTSKSDSLLLGHPFIKKLPQAVRAKTLDLIDRMASDGDFAPAFILSGLSGLASTQAATQDRETQRDWRIVLKALADDWDNALDCAEQLLVARHKRSGSCCYSAIPLANARFDTHVSIPTSLIHHPFVKSLPEALRLPALRILYALASDDPNPAPPQFLVLRACAIATNAAANETGAVHHNGRVLLGALADNWEEAIDCVNQILLTPPTYIRMERVEFIARQMWALNSEGRA
jgi:hypothetical protein